MHIHAGEIAGIIKSQIQSYGEKIIQDDTGRVLSISDGIAYIEGLDRCMANEMIEFEGGARALALNLEENCVAAALLNGEDSVREGTQAQRSGKLLSVPVGFQLLGRVTDALGHPIDGKGEISADDYYPIESPAPGIMDRKSVNRPLETGIKAIDSMIPIGKGQRELIIGDRQTGKTSIAVDTILHQRDKGVICIYVAIGQKQSSVASIAKLLEKEGAMPYSIIISAPSSGLPALEYIAPYTGCAMAEFFMRRGMDVLIVYDDLSRHAAAYRALSLLLRRPPGREAYPGDIFYLHSRLLERAGQLNDEAGGGSITALPIVETLSGDVSAYIPTNVISITDGQVFLESELYRAGMRPAVNPGISVSRVGGSAQIPAIRKLSGKLKIMYSQYQELKSFAQFGSELDPNTLQRLRQGRRIAEVLKQQRSNAVPIEKQAAILFALINGYLDDIETEQLARYEAELYTYLDENCEDILKDLRESGDLSEENTEKLSNALQNFTARFVSSERGAEHAL